LLSNHGCAFFIVRQISNRADDALKVFIERKARTMKESKEKRHGEQLHADMGKQFRKYLWSTVENMFSEWPELSRAVLDRADVPGAGNRGGGFDGTKLNIAASVSGWPVHSGR